MRVFLLLAFLFSPFAISKHVALFRNASHSIPTLHQNLDTLLPFLPDIAAGWSASVRKETSSSVLLVTLATPAFKHLLLNFMCFMHHRLKDADYQPGKYLVVTSSQELATWLSDRGVVSLILQPEDLMANATNDIFSSLRQLDLVLPAAAQSPVNEAGKQKTLPWGSLHYQSLMLERTVISTVLAGALSESQKSAFEQWEVDCGWQPEAKDDIQQWRRPVGGILLADNDAVWSVRLSALLFSCLSIPGFHHHPRISITCTDPAETHLLSSLLPTHIPDRQLHGKAMNYLALVFSIPEQRQSCMSTIRTKMRICSRTNQHSTQPRLGDTSPSAISPLRSTRFHTPSELPSSLTKHPTLQPLPKPLLHPSSTLRSAQHSSSPNVACYHPSRILNSCMPFNPIQLSICTTYSIARV